MIFSSCVQGRRVKSLVDIINHKLARVVVTFAGNTCNSNLVQLKLAVMSPQLVVLLNSVRS